jgi:hypothetical protein
VSLLAIAKKGGSASARPFSNPAKSGSVAKPAPTPLKAESDESSHLQLALDADLAALKTIRNIEEKADFKERNLKNYLPHALNAITQKHSADTIAPVIILWLIDTFNVAKMIELLPGILAADITPPPQMTRRCWIDILCDEWSELASKTIERIKNSEQGPSPSDELIYQNLLVACIALDEHLTPKQNVPAEVAKGKLLAGVTKLAYLHGDTYQAAKFGVKAMQVNPKAGVKGVLKEVLSTLLSKDSLPAGIAQASTKVL